MNGRVCQPVGLEEVLNLWDCGFLEGLDDVAGPVGRRIIALEG